MVYVNSKKYACESCIKGHRSSSCHHNGRPLFEIKKKGRPVSQCDKCREARKSRRIHAKCTCETERNDTASVTPVNGEKQKGKRFIPTVPSLPNGLKDALRVSGSSSSESNAPRRPVDALLNPCHCKDVYNCKCRPRLSDSFPSLDTCPRRRIDPAIFSDGLSALALVASCCSPAVPPVLPPLDLTLQKQSSSFLSADAEGAALAGYSVPSPASHDSSEPWASGNTKRKRTPRSSPVPDNTTSEVHKQKAKLFRSIVPAPSDTRDEFGSTSVFSTNHGSPLPSIPTLMNVSADTVPLDERSGKDAGTSHCCCGTRCECAGCEIHGPATVPKSQPSWVDDPAEAVAANSSMSHPASHGHGVNCTEDCPTCVDYDGGIELPPFKGTLGAASSSSQSSTPPYLAAFLARAASLPAPPPHARSRSSLDPMNVTVYPSGLFTRPRGASESAVGGGGGGISDDSLSDEWPRAFGLVRVPKLEECCGGRCGCAEDACGCGDKCDGCCMDTEETAVDGRENEVDASRLSPSVSFTRRLVDVSPPAIGTDSESLRACCSRS